MKEKKRKDYPSHYPPGVDKDLDEVWKGLDTIKEGVIPMDVRAFLAGYFTGLIKRVRADTKGD